MTFSYAWRSSGIRGRFWPGLFSGLENVKFHVLNSQRKNPAEAGFRKREVSLVSILHWENDTEYLPDQLITA